MNNTNRAWLQIDSGQLICNLRAIRAYLNSHNGTQVKICLPVKCNAYGHGIQEVAKLACDYVDYFAIASLNEAVALRELDLKWRIIFFGGFHFSVLSTLLDLNIELSIVSEHSLDFVIDYCQTHKRFASIHLKIDTGMNRYGVGHADALAFINKALSAKCVSVVGVYSHLACGNNDHVSQHQIDLFRSIVTYVKNIDINIICSIANSDGLMHYHDAFFDMVRPGILSYGYNASYDNNIDNPLNSIKPCMLLIARVVQIHNAIGGVSYDHTCNFDKSTKIATISIGYGDGYPRRLSNIGLVAIKGKFYPVVGTICMDALMVNIDNDANTVAVGDEVFLMCESVSANSLAQLCDTNVYEIITGFGARLPRLYTFS